MGSACLVPAASFMHGQPSGGIVEREYWYHFGESTSTGDHDGTLGGAYETFSLTASLP